MHNLQAPKDLQALEEWPLLNNALIYAVGSLATLGLLLTMFLEGPDKDES